MKNFRILLLFIFGLLVIPTLLQSRSNPIMVIELDCGFDEEEVLSDRNKIVTRDIPTIAISCDEDCDPGYIRDTINFGMDECQCIPDCATLFADCVDCDGESYWETGFSMNNGEIGRCACDAIPSGTNFCGCPPWLEEVPSDFSASFVPNCIIVPGVGCFDGNLTVQQQIPDCDNPVNGLITATVFIQSTLPDTDVPIIDILNCNLIDENGDVLEFLSTPGLDFSFRTDDMGLIELNFQFDPNAGDPPTWVYLDGNAEPVELILLTSPEALCLRGIPTLSTWMVITLGLILAISGLLFVKRREVRAFMAMF